LDASPSHSSRESLHLRSLLRSQGPGNDTMVDTTGEIRLLAARSSNTIVDDYFRDQPALAAMPSNTIVDDYFRDQPALARCPRTRSSTTTVRDQPRRFEALNTIVDDYFRESAGARFDALEHYRRRLLPRSADDRQLRHGVRLGGLRHRSGRGSRWNARLTGLGLGLIAARQSREAGRTRPKRSDFIPRTASRGGKCGSGSALLGHGRHPSRGVASDRGRSAPARGPLRPGAGTHAEPRRSRRMFRSVSRGVFTKRPAAAWWRARSRVRVRHAKDEIRRTSPSS
jgi:hypothetical protein